MIAYTPTPEETVVLLLALLVAVLLWLPINLDPPDRRP